MLNCISSISFNFFGEGFAGFSCEESFFGESVGFSEVKLGVCGSMLKKMSEESFVCRVCAHAHSKSVHTRYNNTYHQNYHMTTTSPKLCDPH